MHLVPIMVWKSLDEASAGLLVGAFPLFWIPSILIVGRMGERWPKHRIAGSGALIAAAGLLLLVVMEKMEVWQILMVFVLMGPNEGSWVLTWSMLTEQFDRRNFGLLRGGIQATVSLLGVGPPVYAGWVFDVTRSYRWVVLPAVLLMVAAAMLNFLMPDAGRRALRHPETPLPDMPAV